MFAVLSAASILRELEERERLEVLFVEIAVFVKFSALSTEDELLESCSDEVLTVLSAASTLEEEFERLKREV